MLDGFLPLQFTYERIVTDGGYDTALQIEALRDARDVEAQRRAEAETRAAMLATGMEDGMEASYARLDALSIPARP